MAAIKTLPLRPRFLRIIWNWALVGHSHKVNSIHSPLKRANFDNHSSSLAVRVNRLWGLTLRILIGFLHRGVRLVKIRHHDIATGSGVVEPYSLDSIVQILKCIWIIPLMAKILLGNSVQMSNGLLDGTLGLCLVVADVQIAQISGLVFRILRVYFYLRLGGLRLKYHFALAELLSLDVDVFESASSLQAVARVWSWFGNFMRLHFAVGRPVCLEEDTFSWLHLALVIVEVGYVWLTTSRVINLFGALLLSIHLYLYLDVLLVDWIVFFTVGGVIFTFSVLISWQIQDRVAFSSTGLRRLLILVLFLLIYLLKRNYHYSRW